MAKNLYRSNRAHERLRAKHRHIMLVSTGKRRKIAKIKADYHDDAISVQSNMGRVLSEQEKTWVWKRAIKRYNLMHSRKTHRMRVYNTFGYNKLTIELESGTMDGNLTEKSYYLAHKKIYSKRFSTDCFSDFFYEKAMRSSVGVADLPEYLHHKASLAELCQQNSFFITNVCKVFETNKGEKDEIIQDKK